MTTFKRSPAWIPFLVLGACATSPPPPSGTPPEWALRPTSLYPTERFVTAVGRGENRDRAVLDAQRQVAESILVRVTSETEARAQSSLNQDTQGATLGAASQTLAQDTRIQSVAKLRGAEVRESAVLANETWVLLVIDKLKARAGVLAEAQTLKSKIESGLETMEGGESFFTKPEVKKNLDQLEALEAEGVSLGVSALVSSEKLRIRFERALEQVRKRYGRVTWELRSEDRIKGLALGLEVCLKEAGVRMTEGSGSRDSPRVEVTFSEVPEHLSLEGWVRVQFELGASVVVTGERARVSEKGSETARSRDAAFQAVRDRLVEKVCEKVLQQIAAVK